MNQPSTPPPAQNLVILSGDLLCVEVHRLIDEIANIKTYHRYEQLRSALNTYTEARFEGILNHTEPSEVFRQYIKGDREPPVPTCAACRHAGRCNGVPEQGGDCY